MILLVYYKTEQKSNNMTVGNLIQLEAKGPEDMYLYGNPQITYFKHVYKRATNFAVDYYRIADNQIKSIEFGQFCRIKIPVNGDLLGGLYLRLQFKDLRRTLPYLIDGMNSTLHPQFTSYVNGIGYQCIEEARLMINGTLIEKLNGEVILLANELLNTPSKKKAFAKMTQFYHPSGMGEFSIGNTNVTNVTTTVMLPFFFSRNAAVHLPICALRNSEIVVELKFKTQPQCLVHAYRSSSTQLQGSQGIDTMGRPLGEVPELYQPYYEEVKGGIEYAELYMKNIFLDKAEQLLFLNKEMSYLIELFHVGTVETLREPNHKAEFYVPMDCYNPTKYVFYVLQREDVFESGMLDNYTSSFSTRYGNGMYTYQETDHLLRSSNIMINHKELLHLEDATLMRFIQSYENFETDSDLNIYPFSFALNPKSSDPTGTLNFSKVLNRGMKVILRNPEQYTTPLGTVPSILIRFYSCSYNILTIKDGLGGLVYKS